MKNNIDKYVIFEIAKWLLDKEPMTYKKVVIFDEAQRSWEKHNCQTL